jgi:hypothetical protein
MPSSDSAETRDSSGRNGIDADQRLTSRFATVADLARFYGRPPAETIRAVVVLKGDEPIAVIGLANRPNCATLFSDYTPEAYERRHSMTVLRAIYKAMQMVKQSKRPVYAVRQEGTDLLVRLGFQKIDEEVYQWHF